MKHYFLRWSINIYNQLLGYLIKGVYPYIISLVTLMKIGIILIISMAAIATYTLPSSKFSPYVILQVSQTATTAEIDAQYKRLRARNKRSRAKKQIIRKAYDQILFERQFNTKESAVVEPKTFQTIFPEHVDQTYVYGYKLPL